MIFIDSKTSASFFLILISVNIIPIGYAVNSVYGQASFSESQPIINDPNLKADLVFQGLRNPTSMAFLGPNDILVLEKDQGTVQRIVNGHMLPQPVLHVNVATEGERGMLGIAIAKDSRANGIPPPPIAGDRGISKVEVSTDGGSTWKSANIKDPLSKYTWVLWTTGFVPTTTQSNYKIVVRATDKTGKVQTAEVRPPYPDGATGYHMINI